MPHENNLARWATVVGAMPRILRYEGILTQTPSRFERLRIVNDALGPHWPFRLADAVGLDTIRANRPSWYEFYVEDTDGLHCPLDPGAPETEQYLGRSYSDMDRAFYAGMGFDGYRLALETPRHVELDTKRIRFDGRYLLELPPEAQTDIDVQSKNRHIAKSDYYGAYGSALQVLFERMGTAPRASGEELERIAAGCLLLLCGGHKGCGKHITAEEEFRTQLDGLIIFNAVRYLTLGQISLEATRPVRAVG